MALNDPFLRELEDLDASDEDQNSENLSEF